MLQLSENSHLFLKLPLPWSTILANNHNPAYNYEKEFGYIDEHGKACAGPERQRTL
jgi:hypothetical protein